MRQTNLLGLGLVLVFVLTVSAIFVFAGKPIIQKPDYQVQIDALTLRVVQLEASLMELEALVESYHPVCVPESEVCDGKDNDCDSYIDENFPSLGNTCTIDTGICASSGVYVCSANTLNIECNAVPKEPSAEVCNNLDDDCDGFIDEIADTNKLFCSSQAGVCSGSRQNCVSGVWIECSDANYLAYNQSYETSPETKCDGLDNDCDGSTDEMEGALRPSCALKVGVCAGTKKICGGTSGWLECTTNDYLLSSIYYEVSETKCDGLDNDCDGSTDEGC